MTIRSAFAFALFVASASAATTQECLGGLTPLIGECSNLLQQDCTEPGQSLFDVLDPAVVCPTCETTFVDTFNTLDTMGCCTVNTLYTYTGESSCESAGYLSYYGLSATISYFCSNVDYLGSDYYCFSDAKDYALETAADVQQIVTLAQSGNQQGAYQAFMQSSINCTQIQESACCYPTLTTFANACGDDGAKTEAASLGQWETAISGICSSFAATQIDFTQSCDGMPSITTETCFAETDAACAGLFDDDDAAYSLLPAVSTLLATILAIAFLTRKH